jgi:septin 2
MEQIAHQGITIYTLPECDDDEDEDYKEQCRQLKEAIPFAIVGSSQVIEVRNRKVRGRAYSWGVVEVENPDHCDFIKLRTMLITHMQDLQEVTQEIHYENYRSENLAKTGGSSASAKRPRVSEHDKEDKLSEREKQLLEKERELQQMQQMLAKMQAEMKGGSAKSPPPVASKPAVNNNNGPVANGRMNGHTPPNPPNVAPKASLHNV